MIREQELLDAIAECQGERNPNAATCRNLAAFYTILDHITEKEEPKRIEYSYSANPEPEIVEMKSIDYKSGSDFSKAVYGRNIDEIMPVIDELMETLQIVNPRLYQGVMRKL